MKSTIELAREAGIGELSSKRKTPHQGPNLFVATSVESLERFRALCRAEALEEAADACWKRGAEHLCGPHWNSTKGAEADDCARAVEALKESDRC